MRIKIALSILLILKVANTAALEVGCKFEEVYGNGTVQQGLLLIKNQNMRYQYNDPNLYTIIVRSNSAYLILNNDKGSFKKLDDKSIILKEIIDIFSTYPNLQEKYQREDFLIKIEKNSNNFIKRIAINSSDLNLSLNLLDCKFEKIFDTFFKYFPLEEFKY